MPRSLSGLGTWVDGSALTNMEVQEGKLIWKAKSEFSFACIVFKVTVVWI